MIHSIMPCSTFLRAPAVAALVALGTGCATSNSNPPGDTSSSNTASFGSSFAGTDGSGGSLGAIDASSPSTDDAGHMTRCDDAGNCSCINIASIGHEGVWGPCSNDTTTAFQNWLNTQSTAHIDNYDTAKPTLTDAFLAKYDVIILQWMVTVGMQNNDGQPWVFDPSEITALQKWVKNGGGIVALNGYQCPNNGCTIYDVVATNQLLSFTDIQFNRDDVLDPAKATTNTDLYCWGGPLPLGAPLYTDAGVPQGGGTWDPNSPIGAHISDLGAYVARSISATTAAVDCTDGNNKYVVHEQVGNGHIVAYGDEWITYSGEWSGMSTSCLNYAYDSGYDPCYEKSPAQVFQIPQFWYNAIKYAASSVQCFTIMNPTIIPR